MHYHGKSHGDAGKCGQPATLFGISQRSRATGCHVRWKKQPPDHAMLHLQAYRCPTRNPPPALSVSVIRHYEILEYFWTHAVLILWCYFPVFIVSGAAEQQALTISLRGGGTTRSLAGVRRAQNGINGNTPKAKDRLTNGQAGICNAPGTLGCQLC